MAQKNATPSKEQQAILKANGLSPFAWVVIKEFDHSMIVRHRFYGDVKHIEKKGAG